jgi:hypothetical protein
MWLYPLGGNAECRLCIPGVGNDGNAISKPSSGIVNGGSGGSLVDMDLCTAYHLAAESATHPLNRVQGLVFDIRLAVSTR